MEDLIERLKEINASLIPPFYAIAEEPDNNVKLSTASFIISKEPLKFDIKYFDLVAINILLANHNDVVYEPPCEIAELTCNLFYLANLRHNIYNPIQTEVVYEALAFNDMPPNMLVYQFLNKVLQNPNKLGDIWFAYILLLWGFTLCEKTKNHPYRSRALVGFINRCYLTQNRKEHEHDLLCDNLKILESLKSYILLCTRDKRYQQTEYVAYMVDSLKLFVVVYLAAIIRRSCTWPEFSKLGDAVLCQKYRFHENIVKIHYEEHKKTGAINQ